jgi:hypothetical protein
LEVYATRYTTEVDDERANKIADKLPQWGADLFNEDIPYPHQARVIIRRELPNLLYAVNGALDVGEEWAVEFVARVNKFLDYFRLNRDRDALCQRAKQADGAVGSQRWYLVRSNFGEQL